MAGEPEFRALLLIDFEKLPVDCRPARNCSASGRRCSRRINGRLIYGKPAAARPGTWTAGIITTFPATASAPVCWDSATRKSPARSAAGVFPTWAHTDAIIDRFALAVDEVFAELSRGIRAGKIRESLRGPVAHSGFRRLL